MINLIPNEYKKQMSKDFYLRLITVFFVILGFFFLFSFIVILPAYFFSSIQEKIINVKLKAQEMESIPETDQDTLLIIKDLQSKLDLVESFQNNQFSFSQKIINEIIFKKIPSIKITEISYQNDIKTGKKINISGIAPNREVLLSFRLALEDNPAFSKVDLPISNFVKGANIEFSLSLVPLDIN